METVVALFETPADAREALAILSEGPYPEESFGYVSSPPEEADTVEDEAVKGAGGGAAAGAAVGAGAGLIASAGVLVIPGIGPLLAAGTLATTLGAAGTGALGGAAIGGAAGAIWGAASDDERSGRYRSGVEQGGALVTAEVPAGEGPDLAARLRGEGAIAVDVYRDEGWMQDV